MYGLSSELIQRFNAVFAQYPQLEKVVIFGSRATGRYRAGSDIDLAVFLKPGQSLDLSQIAQQLDDLNTPYMVDLVAVEQLANEALIEHIHQHGQVFYPVT